MTSSKSIIDALLEGKLVSVKENTESVLNYKLANKLQEKYQEISPSVFEAKKLDPVDKDELKGKHKDREDKDVDNDGDVDDSDKFLHKKRKAISKAIKNEDHDCDEIHPDVSHKEWEKTQEEGADLEIAKEREIQAKSKEKSRNIQRRAKAERRANKEAGRV